MSMTTDQLAKRVAAAIKRMTPEREIPRAGSVGKSVFPEEMAELGGTNHEIVKPKSQADVLRNRAAILEHVRGMTQRRRNLKPRPAVPLQMRFPFEKR